MNRLPLRLLSTALCSVVFMASSLGLAAAHPSLQTATPQATTAKKVVKITNFKFKPRRITIKVGTKVVWVNHDGVQHTATANSFKWNTGTIDPNHKGHHKFKKVGVFKYHCSFHPNMHGRITVVK